MEQDRLAQVSAPSVRKAYLELQEFLMACRMGAHRRQLHYFMVPTHQPFVKTVNEVITIARRYERGPAWIGPL